ncbi:hypothetical protein [Methanocrinis sp.]|uniref:hypothetical protein n=1 Tax=Methanocrinis sp. TaxID=3101522 RepID=UPI003D125B68
MFEPDEESTVLEMVCGFLDIPQDDMMKIGDETKNAVFGPDLESEEEAVKRLRGILEGMSKEEAVIAGMFISGLLRCNLAQQRMGAMRGSERPGEAG